MPYTDNLIKKFWEKVAVCQHGKACQECCWPWVGAKNATSYGILSVYNPVTKRSKNVLAHRISWEIANQQQIPAGLWALHKCNNRPCCNDAHIYAGTAQENTNDCIAAGDHISTPERLLTRKTTKLTVDDVKQIRRFVRKGETMRHVGDLFGISPSHVADIVSGKKWQSIDDDTKDLLPFTVAQRQEIAAFMIAKWETWATMGSDADTCPHCNEPDGFHIAGCVGATKRRPATQGTGERAGA